MHTWTHTQTHTHTHTYTRTHKRPPRDKRYGDIGPEFLAIWRHISQKLVKYWRYGDIVRQYIDIAICMDIHLFL